MAELALNGELRLTTREGTELAVGGVRVSIFIMLGASVATFCCSSFGKI